MMLRDEKNYIYIYIFRDNFLYSPNCFHPVRRLHSFLSFFLSFNSFERDSGTTDFRYIYDKKFLTCAPLSGLRQARPFNDFREEERFRVSSRGPDGGSTV